MARIFGQFELVENIGSGFLAELFKARAIHEPDKPALVVKRIRPEFRYDTNLMARFVEGAQMVVGLEHPNIAAVHDAGVQQGRYYAALEHIAGKDLRHIQNKFETTRRALPVPVAMYLMTEVCKGLAFIHSALGADGVPLGLVHADVSPQNVMVSFAGAVKLINVEGAWFRQKGWAPQKGKVAYMSPEQAAGEDVDPRSDVFSAGIMFWEILTGKKLFEGQNDPEIREAVAHAVIVSPAEANRMVPVDLSEIVLRALSRHPGARFPTVSDMLQALRGFAERSRLTFSSKQIASWMRMTFPEDASKAPPERSPSEQVATVKATARDTSIPPRPRDSAPGLSDEDLPDFSDDDADEPYSDDATCIDPTSQMLAALDSGGVGASREVVADEAQFSKPTPAQGVPAVALDRSKSPTRETLSRPVAPSEHPAVVGVASTAGPTHTLRLDQAMRAHRKLEKEVRTSEVQAVHPGVAVVTDGEPPKERPPRPKSSPVPIVPPDPATLAGKVDERDASDLDDAMKSRRSLGKRMTGEGPRVRLRFERAKPPTRSAMPPAPDERKSMIAILLIVGSLLAVGLALLAWMMLSAETEEPTVQRLAPAVRPVACARRASPIVAVGAARGTLAASRAAGPQQRVHWPARWRG